MSLMLHLFLKSPFSSLAYASGPVQVEGKLGTLGFLSDFSFHTFRVISAYSLCTPSAISAELNTHLIHICDYCRKFRRHFWKEEMDDVINQPMYYSSNTDFLPSLIALVAY